MRARPRCARSPEHAGEPKPADEAAAGTEMPLSCVVGEELIHGLSGEHLRKTLRAWLAHYNRGRPLCLFKIRIQEFDSQEMR
jgi:hypothetical protein